MQSPDDYTPKYVRLDDIPLEVPDSYSVDEKSEALFQAEPTFEFDYNGGETVADDELTPLHQTAVANLATYHLVRGAVGNQDVTLGDLGDGGDQRESHAMQFKETYEAALDSLFESGPDTQSGTYFGASGTGDESTTANAGPYSRRHRLGNQRPEGYGPVVDDQFIDDD